MTSLPPGPAGLLVSCILPTFNAEKYLREALDSIRTQTYSPLEIIVADDGSSDRTVAIAESYGADLRVVRQEPLGPAATRNLGVRSARGEFVAFLDPDDLWHREKLARQVAFLGQNPEQDMCVAHVMRFWDEEFQEERARLGGHPRARDPVPGYATTTLLARRNVFDRVGAFDSGYWFADAVEWFLRAEERGLRCHLMPDVLTYHRMHGNNLTKRRRNSSREEFLAIVKRRLDSRRSDLPSGP